jgi:L-ascorbate metabolism protein UlaG (beta-lactamase superfamily)
VKRLAKVVGLAALAAAAAAIIERFFFATPRYRGPRSDHFDGKRFHNPNFVEQDDDSFLKWMLTREPGRWRKWTDVPPGPPPQRRVDGGRLRLTLINHASTLIQMDGVNILTDPIWSERCSPVSWAGPKRHRPPGIRFEDLPPIDAVLVSHNHYDHLDRPTLRRLRPSPVITPLGNAAWIPGARELDWWQSTEVKGVRITIVPAQHFSARAVSDRDASLWGGFVISGPSGNVFFAGDTGWGPHFAQIRERFPSIRLALLPIGAYLPRWFMRPVHIDPNEALDAHAALGAKTSVPMHYGTFRLGDDGETQPLEDLRGAISARGTRGVDILDFGHAADIP